eukprot:jgi/Mesvir1/7829/Mv11770-RA.1
MSQGTHILAVVALLVFVGPFEAFWFQGCEGRRLHDASTSKSRLRGVKPQAGEDEFVRVSGTGFALGGQSFHFDGVNSPYLMDQAASGKKYLVTRGPLQYAPGKYNGAKWDGLDWVVSEIRKRGLKAVIPFTDQWTQHDGIRQYVEWSGSAHSNNDFFSDGPCKSMFRNHVAHFLNRRNAYTGFLYKDDPTIAAWNLANEPRCPGCASEKLDSWIREMSDFVRGSGAKQLISTGVEGFFRQGGGLNPTDWDGYMGQHFPMNHAHPNIDFAVYHFWPDNWFPIADIERKLKLMRMWMDAHMDTARALGKPLVLEEFGKELDQGGILGRNRFFSTAYDVGRASETSGGPHRGVMFWAFGEGLSYMLPRYVVGATSSTFQSARQFFMRG